MEEVHLDDGITGRDRQTLRQYYTGGWTLHQYRYVITNSANC